MDNSVEEKEVFLMPSTSTPRVRIIPPEPNISDLKSRKRGYPSESSPSFNPDDYGEMIAEDMPKPVCEGCSLAFMSWAAFEFHVLRYHIHYRPYRCAGCKTLSFHTEAEGRHHSTMFHNQNHAAFSLIKRTDFELENEWMECLMNAKCTDQIDVTFSRNHLNQGLEMVEKLHISKFRAQRVQLPYCIRYEEEPITVATEPELQVAQEGDAAAFEEEVVEPEEFFEEANIEYNYQDSDILNEIP